MSTHSVAANEPIENAGNKVLPVVFNILDKWDCNQNQQMALLGLSSRSTLNKYRSNPESAKVSKDLLERMSYLLNIHKCLRILFTSEDSVYRWVQKPNSHPFFAGRSAMDVMSQGRVADLYEVASRLNAWRGGRS
ncbi:MbcA/ParS/Xre antitoxin family protein [Photobacterium sp. CCB-ST2H9]|uniref:MbcA/ParS/Xre antitoxin family protein n=1 Tax=unclassified Photobacterium TaxID=2628852 RepID=UPI002003357C|nr:MbcA/ParS/Xre antitoxin family protein [Photobacterium sp. CCB-ST2H9]UTM58835.1 MbcA/ParS/Xre antitoxin family protein [Photobacterium sp. CCB-ST2H9]